ncbi:hypothetical protein [Endozoicomonas sp. ALB115]|uniref:hypothetical protein n=2 Tax=unclassified Endozoicomonas TaxID=2644528 RepID=UPI003BB5AFB4
MRELLGLSGDATNRKQGQPDLDQALELLNKTPYSSINNATGLKLDTDDKGAQFLSILGAEDSVLGRLPMTEVERQLSNLNNYTTRERTEVTQGREAILKSKELAEGAAAARDLATSDNGILSMGYTLDDNNRYTRPKYDPNTGESKGFEEYNAVKEGQNAYDAFMAEYGPREASSGVVYDPNFKNTQTAPQFGGYGLGFSTRYRTEPETTTTQPGYDDIIRLARQAAGGDNAASQSTSEQLPAPDQTGKTKADVLAEANRIRQQAGEAAQTNQQGYGSVMGEIGQHVEGKWDRYQANIIAQGRYGTGINNEQADAMAAFFAKNQRWPASMEELEASYKIPVGQQISTKGLGIPNPISQY